MNLRRLKYFVKIVDAGSFTQASDVLHVAQPALSHQLATLEAECGQQLLLRTQKGVVATPAGQALYRHAQIILRQVQLAHADVSNAADTLSGQVSVGLTPGTAAAGLALPLLKAVQARHPEIVLHLNENFGTALCDAVRGGRMDMVTLYGGKGLTQGLSFDPLLTEDLFAVCREGSLPADADLTLTDLRDSDLLLPCADNQLRRFLDRAFAQARVAPRVVAEMETSTTLAAAVTSGVGITLLPVSAARAVASEAHSASARDAPLQLRRIGVPTMQVPLALCACENVPMSDAAQAVKDILMELVSQLQPEAGLHLAH